MPLLYTIGKLAVGPTLRLAFRPTVEGLENVPETGGAIFAGNHPSVADKLFLRHGRAPASGVLGEVGIFQGHRREGCDLQVRSSPASGGIPVERAGAAALSGRVRRGDPGAQGR